jgi:hypothetical protein
LIRLLRIISFFWLALGLKMRVMSKKTGMNDSSLWIITIVLLGLTVWMYFRR